MRIGGVVVQERLGDGPGIVLSHGAASHAHFAFMEPKEIRDGPVAPQRHRERSQRPHSVRLLLVEGALRIAHVLVIPEIRTRQYGMTLPQLPRFHVGTNVPPQDLKRFSTERHQER
ncbi:hypothetical protein ACWD6R_06505 [Streptomyces sp. NPDC005151]